MTAWTDWEVLRRQVVAAGWIVDGESRRHPAKWVRLCEGSGAIGRKKGPGKSIPGMSVSGSRYAQVTHEGLYFFINLPGGRYTVQGRSVQGIETDKAEVTVRWKKDGKAELARVDLDLRQ